MAASNIDSYLADLDEPKRSALEQLRRDIVAALPDAEECISYGMPAYRVQGKIVAGFAAFKDHLSYLPHSGSVLAALEPDLADYEHTKGSWIKGIEFITHYAEIGGGYGGDNEDHEFFGYRQSI